MIDPSSLPSLRTTTHTFATICNQYVAGTPTDLITRRLVVELNDDGTTAHRRAGQRPRSGRAKSSDPQEAVVARCSRPRAAPRLPRRPRGHPRRRTRGARGAERARRNAAPGFILSEDDLLQATAAATLRRSPAADRPPRASLVTARRRRPRRHRRRRPREQQRTRHQPRRATSASPDRRGRR